MSAICRIDSHLVAALGGAKPLRFVLLHYSCGYAGDEWPRMAHLVVMAPLQHYSEPDEVFYLDRSMAMSNTATP